MKILRKAGFLVLAGLVTSCAPPPGNQFTEADEATIRASEEDFQEAIDTRDWAAIAALYTDDAVLMPPGQPTVKGQTGVEAWHAATPEGVHVQLAVVEISGSGDMAYVHGTYTMTMPAGDTTATATGKYLEIRNRQADGSWPISVDIFNADAPTGPPPEMGM